MSKRKQAKTATTQKGIQIVSRDIIVRAPERRSWDVGAWRSAIRSADMGRHRQLYDLFDDIIIDGTLSDAIDKRVDAILNANLVYLDREGKEVESITEIIDSECFDLLQREILNVRMYGRSAVEMSFERGEFTATRIDPKHIDLEHKQIITDLSNAERGIPYEGLHSLIVLGTPRNYGLILKAAPYSIYKRGGFGDWAQWIELFGMPQRIGKYNALDPAARTQLEQAFRNAGGASWLVIPKEADIETRETSSGNGISFKQFRDACNEEMLITILGQTMTTVAGERGARSLGDVHKTVEESKNKSDMRFVQRILNARVRPFLEARGLPTAGGRFIFPDVAESIGVGDIVALSNIIPIPATFIRDKYGIPAPSEGEEIAGTKQQEPDPESDPEPDSESMQGRKKKRLSDFFAFAPTLGAGLARLQTRLTSSITGKITLADSYSIDIRKLVEEAIREIYSSDDEAPNRHLFNISNDALQHGARQVFGVSFGKRNPDFLREFRHNTAVFAAFKAHKQTQAMINALYDEKGDLRSFREFRKTALKISKSYNELWLRTEYNTAVRAARAAVNYRDALRTKHLYPNLEYLESSASHKRERHQGWVGTILPIEHPWWDQHMPPSDWNCACSVRRTDKAATGVPDELDQIPSPLRNNPGKTASPVKLSEHPYLKGSGEPECLECRRLGIVPKHNLVDDNTDAEKLCPMHLLALESRMLDFAREVIEQYNTSKRQLEHVATLGKSHRVVLEHLAKRGVQIEDNLIYTLPETILKYTDHPKAGVLPMKDVGLICHAIHNPQNIYIQTKHKGAGNYIFTYPYGDKLLKVVVHFGYKRKGGMINWAKSWGLIEKADMKSNLYEKIK